jgi:hypothetical protein
VCAQLLSPHYRMLIMLLCGWVCCRFRDRVLEQLSEGRYRPALDTGLVTCLDTLPWWKQNGSKVVAAAQPVDTRTLQRHQRLRQRHRRQLEQPARPRL